jgi:hypothetical protein
VTCSVHNINWSTQKWYTIQDYRRTAILLHTVTTKVNELRYEVCFHQTYCHLYTRLLLSTSTFNSGRFHWDVCSCTLSDANKSYEKKTVKCTKVAQKETPQFFFSASNRDSKLLFKVVHKINFLHSMYEFAKHFRLLLRSRWELRLSRLLRREKW